MIISLCHQTLLKLKRASRLYRMLETIKLARFKTKQLAVHHKIETINYELPQSRISLSNGQQVASQE
jgi:hypothetical protein